MIGDVLVKSRAPEKIDLQSTTKELKKVKKMNTETRVRLKLSWCDKLFTKLGCPSHDPCGSQTLVVFEIDSFVYSSRIDLRLSVGASRMWR